MNKYYGEVVGALVECIDVVKATKFVSPTRIFRATRKSFRGGKPRVTDNIEMVVTVGRPNYAERDFIKVLKKAGEPFPVKKVVRKYYKAKKK